MKETKEVILKRKISVFLVLTLIFTVWACNKKFAESSISTIDNDRATVKDGIYNVSTNGNNGAVELEIEFRNGKIFNITIISQNETPILSDGAFTEIPKMIIERQSVAVDAVSGATYTSNAIINGVIEAIGLAGGNVAVFKKGSDTKNVKRKGRK